MFPSAKETTWNDGINSRHNIFSTPLISATYFNSTRSFKLFKEFRFWTVFVIFMTTILLKMNENKFVTRRAIFDSNTGTFTSMRKPADSFSILQVFEYISLIDSNTQYHIQISNDRLLSLKNFLLIGLWTRVYALNYPHIYASEKWQL